MIENISIKGELLFTLESKKQWISRVQQIMPAKLTASETWVWVDINGNVFERGADFRVADEKATYPCKVYRLQSVSTANTE